MYILFLKRATALFCDQILLLSISNSAFKNSAWCVQAVVDPHTAVIINLNMWFDNSKAYAERQYFHVATRDVDFSVQENARLHRYKKTTAGATISTIL